MRGLSVFVVVLLGSAAFVSACGVVPDLLQQNQADAAASASTASDASASDGAVWVGQGCGVERESGLQLCVATSMCPNLVIDTEQFPHCGFRIRGSAIDLVCGCNGDVCPMGVFTTCTQAMQLLSAQTESSVCAQVNEGRCLAGTSSSSSSTSSTSSTSSSTSGGGPNCDKQCMAECGGGAACASLCNCGG